MEEGLGRRERFDLKDEQKAFAAAHLGDRREGGLSHNQPWGFLSRFVLTLSLSGNTGDVSLQETHKPAVRNCTPK